MADAPPDPTAMTAFLPLLVRNLGAAPLLVKVDGQPDKTINPGKQAETHDEEQANG
jgi:hypothetical protein